MQPVALTIAGSDPSGGAGIQADLKTFQQFKVYGASVITLITAQNTRGIQELSILDHELVVKQLRSVLEDLPVCAIKLGALGNAEIICSLSKELAESNFPLVLDPVMKSKNKVSLMGQDALTPLTKKLFPTLDLITPNIDEAEQITGKTIKTLEEMKVAAEIISTMGPKAVLIKGGHLAGDDAVDVLFHKRVIKEYPAKRINTQHTHGTGCTLSAAITAHLALGHDVEAAVANAKKYITEAILSSPNLGQGQGPVNHHAQI